MVNPSHPVLFVILLIISGLTIPLPLQTRAIRTASSTVQPAGPGVHKTYWLQGGRSSGWNGSGINPGPLLTVSDGDTLTILFQSVDGISHSWFLDFNNNVLLDSNSNEVITRSPDFNSTTNPWFNFTRIVALGTVIPHGGSFTYRCAQHAGFMYGTFKFYAGPVASFDHTPTTPLVGHPVSFDASASSPTYNASAGYATIMNYTWDFADGNTTSSGNTSTIIHSYSTNKTYIVILTITDTASLTDMTSRSLTILNPPPTPFNYTIQVIPGSATIIQSQNTTTTVTLSLTSGAPENVTLSSAVTPSSSTIRVSFNATSGFPTYSASMKIISSPSTPSGNYTVTVRAVSTTGVAHNATFTLTLNPSSPIVSPPPPNYFLPALIGTVAALSVLIAFVALTRLRKRLQLG